MCRPFPDCLSGPPAPADCRLINPGDVGSGAFAVPRGMVLDSAATPPLPTLMLSLAVVRKIPAPLPSAMLREPVVLF